MNYIRVPNLIRALRGHEIHPDICNWGKQNLDLRELQNHVISYINTSVIELQTTSIYALKQNCLILLKACIESEKSYHLYYRSWIHKLSL